MVKSHEHEYCLFVLLLMTKKRLSIIFFAISCFQVHWRNFIYLAFAR